MVKFFKILILIVVLLVGGFIWWLVDYPSPRHWIQINPIVDASSQKEGLSEFVLPAGEYVIVVSCDDRQKEEGVKIDIDYTLEIPSQALRIQKQKKVDVGFVENTLLDNVSIKQDKARGVLKVKVLTPSKGKVSVGLATNRYAWM